DPRMRDWFRGSAAHNTVRIDGREQAEPVHPFRWADKPEVSVDRWTTAPDHDLLIAVCLYGGFVHRRYVYFHKPGAVFIVDEIDGPPGEHDVEQFWHFGRPVVAAAGNSLLSIGAHARMAIAPGPGCSLINAWRSRVFGHKESAPVLSVRYQGRFPALLAAALEIGPAPAATGLELDASGGEKILMLQGAKPVVVRLPPPGDTR